MLLIVRILYLVLMGFIFYRMVKDGGCCGGHHHHNHTHSSTDNKGKGSNSVLTEEEKKRQSKLNKFISQLLYNGEETYILQQLKPMLQSEDKASMICLNHKKYH